MYADKHRQVIRLIGRWQVQYGHLVSNDRSQTDSTHIYIGRGTVYGNRHVMQNKTVAERIRVCLFNFYDLCKSVQGKGPGPTRAEVIALWGNEVICHCNDKSNDLNHKKWCHGFALMAFADTLYHYDLAKSGAQNEPTNNDGGSAATRTGTDL